jgi:hypothetical protein
MSHPLWRQDGSVIYNCCWPSPAQSFSGRSPARLIKFYCLRFETHPTWRAKSLYLYPPGIGWPSYTPRHWVPFSSSSTIRRATVEVFDPASTRAYIWLLPGWYPCYTISWHTPRRKHRFQQFHYCSAGTRCHGNLFVSWSLSNNESTKYNIAKQKYLPLFIYISVSSKPVTGRFATFPVVLYEWSIWSCPLKESRQYISDQEMVQ